MARALDLVTGGGFVVDGTGAEPFEGDRRAAEAPGARTAIGSA